MYKKHEQKLMWLAFGAAVIMFISILARIFGG
ncbi:hypothetical protein SAMN05421676_105117 [Salinibacillus kushneri]|uniref:Uncharacterized protein n=1 Tax=Salinibacillus kushneri TaxID=237682 RepID=A0A1I0EYC0_9BACI|nr:hypothetical protein SAMN05421676_105117 [Salinibacillus kushneri]